MTQKTNVQKDPPKAGTPRQAWVLTGRTYEVPLSYGVNLRDIDENFRISLGF
jgi:hypothetical protein